MFEALAIAAPLVLADERDWPFSVDEGSLTCVWSTGQKVVFFFEARPQNLDQDGDFEPRHVIVSANPVDLTIGNIGNHGLFAPVADVADLIRRVAPYAQLGQRLCDQPPGSIIGRGEL